MIWSSPRRRRPSAVPDVTARRAGAAEPRSARRASRSTEQTQDVTNQSQDGIVISQNPARRHDGQEGEHGDDRRRPLRGRRPPTTTTTHDAPTTTHADDADERRRPPTPTTVHELATRRGARRRPLLRARGLAGLGRVGARGARGGRPRVRSRSRSAATGSGAATAPSSRSTPGRGLAGVDVVFPVLHGPFGEDGTVQGLLECLDVPVRRRRRARVARCAWTRCCSRS